MTALEEQIRLIVDALRARNNRRGELRPIILGAAVDEITLASRLATAPFELPPSYVALLQLHDGIEGFYGEHGELLPARYRGQLDAAYADRVDLTDRMLIAADGAGHGLFLDGTDPGPEGETPLIEVTPDGMLRHASLSAFLETYVARLSEI
ncbi:MAG: hypothetical protein AB8I08_17035 [Sandaracinaceae bacterium]